MSFCLLNLSADYLSAEMLPFESGNGDKGMDEAFLELLKGLEGGAPKGSAATSQLADLDLREQDVAKVCIYSQTLAACSSISTGSLCSDWSI